MKQEFALDALTHPTPTERQLLLRWVAEYIRSIGLLEVLLSDGDIMRMSAEVAVWNGCNDMIEMVATMMPTQRMRYIGDARRCLQWLEASAVTEVNREMTGE